MTTPEGEIKKKIKEFFKTLKPDLYYDMVQGGAFSKPGAPDIVVCYKGNYIGIEVKTPTGRQSEIQKLRQSEITAAGGVYLLVRSSEEVKSFFKTFSEEPQ